MRYVRCLQCVLAAALALCTVLPTAARAQTNVASWTGEWGSFAPDPAHDDGWFLGRGLRIGDCNQGSAGPRCAVSLLVHTGKSNGDASGYLIPGNGTTAVAHLLAPDYEHKSSPGQEHCTLQLAMATSGAAVLVRPGAGDCSYFLTPGGTFAGPYPLHTRELYVSNDPAACFATTERAQTALCTDKSVADQAFQWMLQYLQVADLGSFGPIPDGSSDTKLQRAAFHALLRGCDNDPNPGSCLGEAFTRSTTELQAKKAAWVESVTAPGDAGAAEKALTRLAGSYRHSFENGDVSGDHFLSTDTLQIESVSRTELKFNVQLNFYNGHECSLQGTASFKRAGVFVFQSKTDWPQFPMCYLEISPGEKGPQLLDPTGGCKVLSCGERGGYGGQHFSWTDRQ